MPNLSKSACEACTSATPKLAGDELSQYLKEVPGWDVTHMGKNIHQKWTFKDFAAALKFVNGIGALAEEEGHHPDITFGWGYVRVSLTTHVIGGLSRNDFIMAAKIDLLLQ